MIKIKKVNMSLEVADKLYKLGYIINFKNGNIYIEKED